MRELQYLLALAERIAGDLQLQTVFLQPRVDMRDIRRQGEACGLRIDLGGALGADGTFIRRAK